MNSPGDLRFETETQPMTISNTKHPINRDDLPCQRAVEGERIEYKTGWWNPGAVIRTPRAFANDFGNLGAVVWSLSRTAIPTNSPRFR
jgi:hypothetical protein